VGGLGEPCLYMIKEHRRYLRAFPEKAESGIPMLARI
jgi:hypothetical protein